MRAAGDVLVLLVGAFGCATGINHWILKNDRIIQKYDTPFFMREPDNLVAFLDQIHYNEYVESSYLKLLRAREQIAENLRFSVRYGEDLVNQAKCAMDYYLIKKRMQYLEVTSSYLQRLDLPELSEVSDVGGEPVCSAVTQLGSVPWFYDNLEGLRMDLAIDEIVIHEEDEGAQNFGDNVRRFAVQSLRQHPHLWKSHTMASYYWRLRGNAKNAIECARLGVMMAPRAFKDIPLLSLGTTLFRAGFLGDAIVLLTAAVEHAPNVAENHIGLASALAMNHKFDSSLHHFDEAERLDPNLLPRTQPVRNFIGCLENLTKKTTKMYSYVEYMKTEVNDFKQLKARISQKHEQLIQQQVPLNSRPVEAREADEESSKRGQYCSTRTLAGSEESVLYCDFYSDMHMRLESKEVDIDLLEKELRVSSQSVIRQVSQQFSQQVKLDDLNTAKPLVPQGKD